jgi:hypothetical protein
VVSNAPEAGALLAFTDRTEVKLHNPKDNKTKKESFFMFKNLGEDKYFQLMISSLNRIII